MHRKAKAIAVTYTNPVHAALGSFKNAAVLLADFMYGTPGRLRLTYAFAFGLAILGGLLMDNYQPLTVCAG